MATNLSSSLLSILEENYPGLLAVMNNNGVIPKTPDELRNDIYQRAIQANPGISSDLPATLIDDLLSTTCGAIAQFDSAKIEAVYSINPLVAPSSFLDSFGLIYGVLRGEGTNPSAYVDLKGTSGLFLQKGFQFTDGQYVFETQQNLTIPSTGELKGVYILANQNGDYTIPPDTITQIISNIPSNTNLTVTNPQYGDMGTGEEADADYRARIIRAGQATCQGTINFIKTCIQRVPNVVARSVSVIVNNSGYSIQVDGGDSLAVGGAIYESCFDIPSLKPSVNEIGQATKSNPCEITTTLTHGLKDGQNVTISGARGMGEINGSFNITYIDSNRFSIPVDTTNSSFYEGGGILETNPRIQQVNIIDGSDSVPISFIRPLQQQVKIKCHWQTSSINSINNDAASQQVAPAIADYINSIQNGEPINTLQLGRTFETSILQIVPQNQITELYFEIYLDGTLTSPPHNSNIISGDPQSYFVTKSDYITLSRN